MHGTVLFESVLSGVISIHYLKQRTCPKETEIGFKAGLLPCVYYFFHLDSESLCIFTRPI